MSIDKFCDIDSIENAKWSVVFDNSPYESLNDTKFDVKCAKAESYDEAIIGTIVKVTFDVLYKNNDIYTVKGFANWFNDVYRQREFSPYYADKATIYLHSCDNDKLIRKFNLCKIFPIDFINEYSDGLNMMSFTATLKSIDSTSDEENKMNDEKELSNILKKAKPYIELISLLDKVEAHIDKHGLPSSFESVGKEFAESLHRYNGLLKSSCISIMKEVIANDSK